MTDLMEGVPRGLTDRALKDQWMPQAHWLPQKTLEEAEALHYDPKNPSGKILLGAIGEKLIGIADNRHIQTVAGNRSGKSVTVIANLFFYDGSVIAIDPKGELATKTAHHRRALGQDVFVLDPFERAEGAAAQMRAQYNPVKVLTLESESTIEDAVQLIDAQIVKSDQEKDPHWNESAGTALLGLLLYTAFGDDLQEEDRNLGTLRRLVVQARRRITGSDEKSYYALPQRILGAIDHLRNGHDDDIADAIEASIRGFYEKSPDEMASVHSTMNRHTAYLDYRSMKRVTAGHDFDLRDLKKNPKGTTIYLCLPANRMGSCKRWLRTFVNQLIDAMEAEQTVPKAPVLAVLDEFAVLGHMKALEEAAGQIASFHLKLWTILQDWGQGEAIYAKRWESFAANAGVSQFFANVDLKTTEYISKRLGKTQVLMHQSGDTSPDQRGRGQMGQSQSKQLFEMLTPDEVAKLFARSDPQKRQLIMLAGKPPAIIQRVEYWNAEAPYAQWFIAY